MTDLGRRPAVGMAIIAGYVIHEADDNLAHGPVGRFGLIGELLGLLPLAHDARILCMALLGAVEAQGVIFPAALAVGQGDDGLAGLLVQAISRPRTGFCA